MSRRARCGLIRFDTITIALGIGEELYPNDDKRENNNGIENDEKVDYYRTQYIDREVKEMTDLVFSNEFSI